jgi:hypothetical protein
MAVALYKKVTHVIAAAKVRDHSQLKVHIFFLVLMILVCIGIVLAIEFI